MTLVLANNGACVVCGAPTARKWRGRNGVRKTCGERCRRAAISRAKGRHRQGGTKIYWVWAAIVQRCTNPQSRDWADYGARGITLCDRWRSFDAFIADMGVPPPGGTIDRIDNAGPYALSNCKWSTAKEQARNRRSTRRIEFAGQSLCAAEWSERTGIHTKTIASRIKHGWPVERALTEPAVIGKNQTGVSCS